MGEGGKGKGEGEGNRSLFELLVSTVHSERQVILTNYLSLITFAYLQREISRKEFLIFLYFFESHKLLKIDNKTVRTYYTELHVNHIIHCVDAYCIVLVRSTLYTFG